MHREDVDTAGIEAALPVVAESAVLHCESSKASPSIVEAILPITAKDAILDG